MKNSLETTVLQRLWQLPGALRMRRERRRRGARELRHIQGADAVLFSPGNSGRTWLRVMLTRAIEQHLHLEPGPPISFDNLYKRDQRAPRLMVTHNRWLPYYRQLASGQLCADYYSSKVVVLVRNPLDTAVSQYHQWLHRSKASNIALKEWPATTTGLRLSEFMDHPATGVGRLCEELNAWLVESAHFRGACIIRYEDLLSDPAAVLEQCLRFIGITVETGVIAATVEQCSFDNMRQREKTHGPAIANSATGSPGKKTPNPDALKARRGGVAGYREELEPADYERFEQLVNTRLDPRFGYDHLPSIMPLQWP